MSEVWRHEAYDFTTWLRENTDVLRDVIDLTLENAEREQPAGSFSVDLVGEDEAGNAVVIENQYGRSDHDHLGKLITYLTAFEAKSAIWIMEGPRPEHVAAVTWLNQATAASFYVLKAEAVRIGDSLPAPLLTLIVGPSEVSREVGDAKRDRLERHILRERFWSGLLDRARERTQLHSNISPGHQSWIGAGAGRGGLTFKYAVGRHDARVDLSIECPDQKANKAIFDQLYAHKDEIEAAFGSALDWHRMDDKSASRISSSKMQSGYRDDEEHWGELQDQMIDAMIRLEQALRPHINQLQI